MGEDMSSGGKREVRNRGRWLEVAAGSYQEVTCREISGRGKHEAAPDGSMSDGLARGKGEEEGWGYEAIEGSGR